MRLYYSPNIQPIDDTWPETLLQDIGRMPYTTKTHTQSRKWHLAILTHGKNTSYKRGTTLASRLYLILILFSCFLSKTLSLTSILKPVSRIVTSASFWAYSHFPFCRHSQSKARCATNCINNIDNILHQTI
jgi:hypothetical protein